MTQHWASCSIVVCSLLALPSSLSASPRAGDPCKQMQHALDRQIDDVKTRQKDELKQCEQSNGRSSGACFSLEDQQKQELRSLRDNRAGQMAGCNGRVSWGTGAPVVHSLNNTYYDQSGNQYSDNENYPNKVADPHPRHPHHPPSNGGDKSASGDKPSSAGGQAARDKNSRSNVAVGGGSSGGSSASSGHSHNGGNGGGGGSYSGSSHSSGGGSSASSGSSSSGSSHSSGGGGSSYSGSSSSGSASSSSSPSSSSASGGHPK